MILCTNPSPILKSKRFSTFFTWDRNISESKLDECQRELGIDSYTNNVPNEEYKEGSEIWNILKMKNSYDLELFEYAKRLYGQQSLYS